MSPPLSLTQSSFLLSSLISSPAHRLDQRPLLSYRPIALSPRSDVGSATISLGATSVTAKISTQVVSRSLEEEEAHEDEAVDEDDAGARSGSSSASSRGVWNVAVGTSPTCVPPVINGTKASRTGNTELDASLIHLSRLLRRHLNHILPAEQFVIIPAPEAVGEPSGSSSPLQPGATYWSLTLDVTINDVSGGNFWDCAWAAAYAAVYRARVPRTRGVAYVAPEEGARAGKEATVDQLGIKSLKGERQNKSGAGAKSGRAVDFELVDVWDEGEALQGREAMGVGITIGLLPNGTHLLDPTLEEELCLPASRRLFIVCSWPSPASPTPAVHATQLLPSMLNLTAGESTSSNQKTAEDALRFPAPPAGAGPEDAETWESQGWGLPAYARVRRGAELGKGYAVELGRSLRQRLKQE